MSTEAEAETLTESVLIIWGVYDESLCLLKSPMLLVLVALTNLVISVKIFVYGIH